MNKPLIAIASLIYGDEFPPGVNYCNAVERAGGRPLYVCAPGEGGRGLRPAAVRRPAAHRRRGPLPRDAGLPRAREGRARAPGPRPHGDRPGARLFRGGKADPGRLPRGAGAQRRPGRHALPAHLRPARGHHRPPEQGDAARGARRSRHAAAPHLRRGGHAARQFDPPPGRRIARAVLCAGGHEPGRRDRGLFGRRNGPGHAVAPRAPARRGHDAHLGLVHRGLRG